MTVGLILLFISFYLLKSSIAQTNDNGGAAVRNCDSDTGNKFLKWANLYLFLFIFEQQFAQKNCRLQRHSNFDRQNWSDHADHGPIQYSSVCLTFIGLILSFSFITTNSFTLYYLVNTLIQLVLPLLIKDSNCYLMGKRPCLSFVYFRTFLIPITIIQKIVCLGLEPGAAV